MIVAVTSKICCNHKFLFDISATCDLLKNFEFLNLIFFTWQNAQPVGINIVPLEFQILFRGGTSGPGNFSFVPIVFNSHFEYLTLV